ncbi:MAG: hypothetical protein ACXWC2_03105 [Ramlibacter sp.]
MRPFARRHAGWPRRGIVLSAALVLALWLTGLLLEAWPAEQTPLMQPWQAQLRHAAVVLHGVGAWIFCLFAGRWAWPHAALVWRRAPDATWLLGLVAAALALLVAASGLLLLYGPGDAHDASAVAHWWTALGWPVLLALHARGLFARRAWAHHEHAHQHPPRHPR